MLRTHRQLCLPPLEAGENCSEPMAQRCHLRLPHSKGSVPAPARGPSGLGWGKRAEGASLRNGCSETFNPAGRTPEPFPTPSLPRMGPHGTPMLQSIPRNDQHCNNKCLLQQPSSLSAYPSARTEPFQPRYNLRRQLGRGEIFPVPTQATAGAARGARLGMHKDTLPHLAKTLDKSSKQRRLWLAQVGISAGRPRELRCPWTKPPPRARSLRRVACLALQHRNNL